MTPNAPTFALAALLLATAPILADDPPPAAGPRAETTSPAAKLFARDNLVAWCIVPFDSRKRGPEERAKMLRDLGFRRFAYDWRGEHIPTFDAELDALKREGIRLEAFWAPGALNDDARRILDVLGRHHEPAQLWVTLGLGDDRVSGDEQERRVDRAVADLKPLAEAAKAVGSEVVLYNHMGWFGVPENQLAIVERLKGQGVANVGVVLNLHHGHEDLPRLAEVLAKLMPYLRCVNLNGMDRDDLKGQRKILPLGQGSADLDVLRTIVASGYHGPIGILGHTQDDAEARLRDNLDGLDWLVPQLDGHPAGPKPTPHTPFPPPLAVEVPKEVAELIANAEAHGDPTRGAAVFLDAKTACFSCHKVGEHGGAIGPDLSAVGRELAPAKVVEAVLWPKREVKQGFDALAVALDDGRVVQGYKLGEAVADGGLTLRDVASGQELKLAKADIEEVREIGTLMPEGVADALTPDQKRDLFRFLIGLGRSPGSGLPAEMVAAKAREIAAAHAPTEFPHDRAPLQPEAWPHWQDPVNRDRDYDFYAKEAEYFRLHTPVPPLLPAYPGLDLGRLGHWGNQNEGTWTDDRWNQADLGRVLAGVFHGPDGLVVPKGVCVRLGDHGELAACFNPETLTYDALWSDGFLKFSNIRYGFLSGLLMDGTARPRPEGAKPDKPFRYHGFYRNGDRVVFAYRLGDVEMLDVPWCENGQFTRVVGPAEGHPLAHLTRGGPTVWPQTIDTPITLGATKPYAVDTITPPLPNPWGALPFFGGHDFAPDGTAYACTMQGDVWRIQGLDGPTAHWRRFASGLSHALGLVVADGSVYVLGRDQLTRLEDLDHDGEADFYECANNSYVTSPAGHDFICGLQRDQAGNFYTASGNQGLVKLPADGGPATVIATGFRNPDGLGLTPEGTPTVPGSEGEWTPTSLINEIRPGGHYGYGGPKGNTPPDLPLVYLPRGLDNSAGGQAAIPDDRWGPLKGLMVHTSFGAGAAFLLLRDKVADQPQGAVVPLPAEFLSGAHRARFNPHDGQLYVSGMKGWGTYTVADGCFQRVRWTGDPVQLPVAWRAHQNGVLVTFSRPLDRTIAANPSSHFIQAWNYRYSAAYGSPELSPSHPGMTGHDPLTIRSATVADDSRSLFLELPDLQPVSQLQLHMKVDGGPAQDLFATIHKLAEPYTAIPHYQPTPKVISAHPMLADLATAAATVPNPWRYPVPNPRTIEIAAAGNLTFSTPTLKAKPGEALSLTFNNPDVVPHNWVLIRPGTLPEVGELANHMVSQPDAAARHYVPKTDAVLAYTDMTFPGNRATISFFAPKEPGRYPFLCSFPGHWMVMNGILVVEGSGGKP